MTLKDKFLNQIESNLQDAFGLIEKKNTDYATDADPFLNFRESAAFAGVTFEQGVLVRLSDKLTRFRNLLLRGDTSGAVGENIVDTLLDAMNYLNIIKTWIDLGRPHSGKVFEELTADTVGTGLFEGAEGLGVIPVIEPQANPEVNSGRPTLEDIRSSNWLTDLFQRLK